MHWKHTPLHEVLTETQSKRALNGIKVDFHELPLIKYSDAALKSLRENGTETPIDAVIRITRKTITYGEKFYYRRVVP